VLGCVRISQTHDETLRPAYTPFLEEAGDDYGLGGGVCDEVPNDERQADAWMDIERTLQDLARNACVGEERSGFRSYGYDYDDVKDCHASMYGCLSERTLPYSGDRKDGVVPMEFVRAPRLGRICVEIINVGGLDAFLPTQSDTQRTGLTLKGRETAVIQQGHSVEMATGLRLISFLGSDVRVTQSALSPDVRGEIRVQTTLLTHEDHGAEIVVAVRNFGCDPYVVNRGDSIGQIQVVGIDDVEIEIREVTHTEISLDTHDRAMAAPAAPRDHPQPGCQRNPQSSRKQRVEHQSTGGPETTKKYDPDAIILEPTGVLQLIASRILMKIFYAARMCRCDLLRAVCGLASCTTKRAHQCDSDLRRLICCFDARKDHCVIGRCGGPDVALELRRVYADADFAGCIRTMRSTAGVVLAVEGPNARVVVQGVSKRQTAASHCTPEAEIVVADYAMRAEGVPVLTLVADGGQRGNDSDLPFRQESDHAIPQSHSQRWCVLAHGDLWVAEHQHLQDRHQAAGS
jgi:dUTPase